jgi:hypothetical protein
MRTVIALIFFATLSSTALALAARENGYAWNKASPQEKEALVKDALRRLGATYPWAEMRACVDAAYARGATEYLLQQEISAVMTLCHVQLK